MPNYYKSAGTTVIQGNGVIGNDFSEPHYKLLATLDSGSKAAIANYGGHGQTGSTGGSTTLPEVTGIHPSFTTNHVEQDSVFKSRSTITSAVSAVAIDLDVTNYACHTIKIRNVLTTGTHKLKLLAGFQSSSSSSLGIYTHQTLNRAGNFTSLQTVYHRRSTSYPGCLFPYEWNADSVSGVISGTELGINVDITLFSASAGTTSQPSSHRGAITGIAHCWGYTSSSSIMFDEDSYFLFTNSTPIDRLWVTASSTSTSIDTGQIEYYADPGMPAA